MGEQSFTAMAGPKAVGAAPEIGVGMLGYAFMGKAHTNAYKTLPYIMYPPPAVPVLEAVCGRNAEAVQEAAKRYGYRKVYTDWREMLADPAIQLFDNGGPNNAHAEPCIAAAAAGKHLLCEKPLAATVPDAEAMVAASQRTGKLLMITFNYRYRSDARYLKRLLVEQRLGRVYHVRAGWMRRRGIPKAGSWFTHKDKSGGGPLIDLGVHVLDLVMWLLGYPEVATVSGATHNALACLGKGAANGVPFQGVADCDVEDLAVGMVRLQNGTTISLEISWASYSSASDDYYVHLMGDQSGADLTVHNYGRRDTVRLFADVDGQPAEVRPQLPEAMSGHEGAVCEFINCIRTGAQPTATAAHGLTIIRLLDALYRSAAMGQEVWLP